MKILRAITSLLLLNLLCAQAFSQEPKLNETITKAQGTEDPAKMFEPREFAGEGGKVLKYRLLKPLGYNPNKSYPLVIFLHGAGERGSDNMAQLRHGMADFCKTARREKNPCYVIAPQCPENEKWADIDWSAEGPIKMPAEASESMKLTLALVDAMLEDAAIDKNRIYITGLSMGGYGTWDAIARRPDFFAAAVPICGGGDPTTAEKIKNIPISCFHGDKDQAVVVEKSRVMIEAIKEAGGAPLYTEYPEVGHDSWTQTYANEATHNWLFSQRRIQAKPEAK
jgi:predicted peptidase